MDGVLIINKPKEYTSHDIVAITKKKLGEKIGHTGTLDPNATGVLPLLVGKATKISKYLVEHDKCYLVTLKLGIKTDTADGEGCVLEEKKVSKLILKEETVRNVLQSFLGKQMQRPPIYSAIKIQGKKLYEYARKGQKVEIPLREIEIFKIQLIQIDEKENQILFEVHCSKGTYIRSLCEDVAEKLGTVGYMKELMRKKVGRFQIEDALLLEDLQEKNLDEIGERILSIETIFSDFPKIELPKQKQQLFFNGVCLHANELGKQNLQEGSYLVYDGEIFLGIAVAKKNLLKRDVIL